MGFDLLQRIGLCSNLLTFLFLSIYISYYFIIINELTNKTGKIVLSLVLDFTKMQ